MKGGFIAFFAGIGTAAAIGMIGGRRLQRAAKRLSQVDLNKADVEDFVALGLDRELADRIIEFRPYRKRIELIERYVLGKADYEFIRDHVGIDVKHAHDAVQVAS